MKKLISSTKNNSISIQQSTIQFNSLLNQSNVFDWIERRELIECWVELGCSSFFQFFQSTSSIPFNPIQKTTFCLCEWRIDGLMVDEEMKEKKKAAGPGHQLIHSIYFIIHFIHNSINFNHQLIPLMPHPPQHTPFLHSAHSEELKWKEMEVLLMACGPLVHRQTSLQSIDWFIWFHS